MTLDDELRTTHSDWFECLETNNCGLTAFDIFGVIFPICNGKPKGIVDYVDFSNAGYENPVLFIVNNKLKIDDISEHFQKNIAIEKYDDDNDKYYEEEIEISEHGKFHELYKDNDVTIHGFIPHEMDVRNGYNNIHQESFEVRCSYVFKSKNIDILHSMSNIRSIDDDNFYKARFNKLIPITNRKKLSLISVNDRQYDKYKMDRYIKENGYYQLLHYVNSNSGNYIMVYINRKCELWQR